MVAAAVSAIAAFGTALLTWNYVTLTKALLAVQTDPNVIVTVVHDKHRATLLMIVIRNIGNGLAKNIRIETSEFIPARAWGIDELKAASSEAMESGPFIKGIKTLGPGEDRRINWGQLGGLKRNLGERNPIITCIYEDQNGKSHRKEMELDWISFEFTDASRTSETRVASALEQLAQTSHDMLLVLRQSQTKTG